MFFGDKFPNVPYTCRPRWAVLLSPAKGRCGLVVRAGDHVALDIKHWTLEIDRTSKKKLMEVMTCWPVMKGGETHGVQGHAPTDGPGTSEAAPPVKLAGPPAPDVVLWSISSCYLGWVWHCGVQVVDGYSIRMIGMIGTYNLWHVLVVTTNPCECSAPVVPGSSVLSVWRLARAQLTIFWTTVFPRLASSQPYDFIPQTCRSISFFWRLQATPRIASIIQLAQQKQVEQPLFFLSIDLWQIDWHILLCIQWDITKASPRHHRDMIETPPKQHRTYISHELWHVLCVCIFKLWPFK